MALPAGRYGVTKNQLLKIKKLPMNTIKLIEELAEKFDLLGSAAFKNSTSVVTQSTDLVESGAVYDVVGWGNKNLLRNIAKSGSKQGIDYTVNNDKSVTCSNTASNSSVLLVGDMTELIVGETYILSGCPKNGADDKYYLRLGLKESASDAWGTAIGKDFGDGYEFTVPANSYGFTVNIGINAGQATNFTYYPMIRKASVTDATYEPYHASVSDSLAEKADNSVIGTVEGANASKAWSVGEHFIKDGQFKEVTQPIASGGAINDSNTVNKPIADCLVKQATFSSTTNSDGNIGLDNTGRKIIAALSDNAYQIVTLYKSSATSTGAHITNTGASPSAITNTAVSGTYYYI